MGQCLPVSHASPEPTGFPRHPMVGRGAPRPHPALVASAHGGTLWPPPPLQSSSLILWLLYPQPHKPCPRPCPRPSTLPSTTLFPSALVCAWLRRASCPPDCPPAFHPQPAAHLHTHLPVPASSWVFLSPPLSTFGVSYQPPGWVVWGQPWLGAEPSAASLFFLEFVSVHLSFPSRGGLSDWNWRMHIHLGAAGWAGNQSPGARPGR